MYYVITLKDKNSTKKWYWIKSGGWTLDKECPAVYESEALAAFDCLQINIMRGPKRAHATVEWRDITLIWNM